MTLSAWEKLHTSLDPDTKTHQEVTHLQIYEYLIPNPNIHSCSIDNILTYGDTLKKTASHAYVLIQLQQFQANQPATYFDVHKDALKYLLTNHNKPKRLSWLYTLLQSEHNFTKNSSMTNWEKELGTTHSHTEWKDAIKTCYQYSHCTNHWELMMKILHRSYLTPVRMSLIFPVESSSCWRQCGAKGNIYHILWECKNICSFWYAVKHRLLHYKDGYLGNGSNCCHNQGIHLP